MSHVCVFCSLMSSCVQSKEHGKNKETHSAEKGVIQKQLADKTASEIKLMADVKVLSSEKVAVAVVSGLLFEVYIKLLL